MFGVKEGERWCVVFRVGGEKEMERRGGNVNASYSHSLFIGYTLRRNSV